MRVGKPEIINTDQGSQYTSDEWISIVKEHGIKISMDGKGRWADNIIIERFWKTLKYENILLYIFDTVLELKDSIRSFIQVYNDERFHQSLGYKTPTEIYTGIAQAPSLVLGKKKEVVSNSRQVVILPNASSEGLLSSPF